MKNKSKITGIRQQAQKSVDKAESSINRFASFMGVLSKGITKDIPDKKTIKKARLFAKNFGGGRSSKVNKMLLGGAIMLPLVLGQMMSKERSTEELLQTQYGGNERAMQSDLDEEQKVRDEGLEKVKTTADENKDIALDKKKDLQAVSQKGPEEAVKSEVNSDDSTLEKMNDRMVTEDQGIDKKNVDYFDELMDRFVFLAKQGAFTVDKGPSLAEQLNNIRKKVMTDIRKFTGGKVDDGVFSLGFGIEIHNPLSKKGRDKIKEDSKNLWNSLFNRGEGKPEKTELQQIEETIDAEIAANEKMITDAGGPLLADEETRDKYFKTLGELNKLKKRLKEKPFEVLGEFMSAANPSSVSSQTSMLNLTVDTGEIAGDTPEARAWLRTINATEANNPQKYNTLVGGEIVPELTQMTIQEVYDMAYSREIGYGNMPQRFGGRTVSYGGFSSHAAGAYQFHPGTMMDRVEEMGLDPTKVLFSPHTQQLLALQHMRALGADPNKAMDARSLAITGTVGGWEGLSTSKGKITYNEAMDLYNKFLREEKSKGDQSSLTPNNANKIAEFTPEGYMPYDDPAGSETQIVAFTPQMQPTNQPGMVVSGGDSAPQIIAVADVGSVLSQIQLNNLART